MIASSLMVIGERLGFPHFSGVYDVADAGVTSPSPGYTGKYTTRQIDECVAKFVFTGDIKVIANKLDHCLAANDSSILLTFVGDSHSMDLFPMSDKIYYTGKASVLNIFQPACRFPSIANEDIVCADFTANATKYLLTNKHKNLVFVIRQNYSPKFIDGTLTSYINLLENFLKNNTSKNINIVYFAPSPKYPAVGPGSLCTLQWFRPAWAISDRCKYGLTEDLNEQLARRNDFLIAIKYLEKNYSNFYVFDPFDVLCGSDGKLCTPLRDGHILYRDESHLTEYGSEVMSEPFIQFLVNHGLLNKN